MSLGNPAPPPDATRALRELQETATHGSPAIYLLAALSGLTLMAGVLRLLTS